MVALLLLLLSTVNSTARSSDNVVPRHLPEPVFVATLVIAALHMALAAPVFLRLGPFGYLRQKLHSARSSARVDQGPHIGGDPDTPSTVASVTSLPCERSASESCAV